MYDRTSTIIYSSMFFKAILLVLVFSGYTEILVLVFIETNLKFQLVLVLFFMDCKNFMLVLVLLTKSKYIILKPNNIVDWVQCITLLTENNTQKHF